MKLKIIVAFKKVKILYNDKDIKRCRFISITENYA